MVKKETFDPKAFSLVIKYGETSQIVPIPFTKRGIRRNTVGGDQTYQMAIDDFTTKFSNKSELLDYIKGHGLASIPDDNYNKISISIIYNGKSRFTSNLSIAYSNQKELVDFIQNNAITGSFSSENPCVKNFNQTIIDYATTGTYRTEYMMFMTNNNNPYFGSDLINTLRKIKKEKLFDKVKTGDAFIAPICRYHNLRGHLMLGKHLEEELEKIYRIKLVPLQEKSSLEPEEYKKTSINIDIVKFPQTKTKPAEEQLPHQLTLFDDYENQPKTK